MRYPANRKSPDLATRFWAKVEKAEGCWKWTGYHMPNGRPMIASGGRPVLAYRVAYELVVGPIPAGLLVCHHCDNGGCVNPEHLFVGTTQDNMDDMVRKGRYTPRNLPKGSAVHNAKLTEEQVAEIRRLLRTEKRAGGRIARLFNVCPTTIYDIKLGRKWRHVQC